MSSQPVASSRTSLPAREDLERLLGQVLLETHAPGIGMAVSVSGRRVAACAGVAALDHVHRLSEASRFEISCLMKFFTALATMELAASGVLRLDACIDEYLPELQGVMGSKADIRLHHLLSHTSGYRGVDITDWQVRWNYSWSRFVEHFNGHAQSFPPGRVPNYEHTEHVILGEVIRRVCGRPPLEVIQELLLTPLGIVPRRSTADMRGGEAFVAQHTYVARQARFVARTVPPFCAFWSASLPDATLSLSEVLSMGEFILDSVHGVGGRKLAELTVQALRQSVISIPCQVASGRGVEQIPSSFGAVCSHYARARVGHNGSLSGQTTALRLDLDARIAMVVGVNAWLPYARDTVVERAFALIHGDAADSVPHPGDRIAFSMRHLTGDFTPEEVVGTYAGSYAGQVLVSRQQDGLRLALGAERAANNAIDVLETREGLYVVSSMTPVLAGFLADPCDGRPALMLGLHAYKRIENCNSTSESPRALHG